MYSQLILFHYDCNKCGAAKGQPCLSMWCPNGADRECGIVEVY